MAAHAAAAALFAAAAVLHTFPLVRRLSTHLPGEGLGDNASFAWNFWWMREALASDRREFFHTDHLIAPFGADLVLHSHTALMAWLGATLTGGLPLVEALNVLLITSVALNGCAAYALALEAGASRGPAAVAGVLFMLAPPLTVRLMGHFNFVAAWPLVLAFWALLRLTRRPATAPALALGGTAAMTAYAESYFLVFLLLFGAVLLLSQRWTAALTFSPRPWTRTARTLVTLAAVLFGGGAGIALTGGTAVSVLGVDVSARSPTNLLTAGWIAALLTAALLARPRVRISSTVAATAPVGRYLILSGVVAAILLIPLGLYAYSSIAAGDYVAPRSAFRTAPAGVDLATLVMGPPLSGVFGGAVRAAYARLGIDMMESSGWLGVLPLGLGLWAVRRYRDDMAFRPWIWIGSASFLWGLGAYATVFGWNTGLLLPQALAPYIPAINNARMPARALIVVSLALSVLAALGLGRVRRNRRAIAAGVVAFACLELAAAPLPLARVPDAGAVVHWLSAQPAGTVVPLPFGVRDGFGARGHLDHGSLLLQSIHRQPLAGGFIARLPPRVIEWYEQTEPFATWLRLSAGQRVERWPSCEDTLKGLRSASVRYVLVERASAPRDVVRFVRRLPVRRAAADEFRTVYVLEDGAACRREPPKASASAHW